MDAVPMRAVRGALAGSAAAGIWAALQPVDKRVFGCEYDDVQLLGLAVTSHPARATAVGTAIHVQNGALFGAVFALIYRYLPLPAPLRGPAAALFEHFALWPLGRFTDRFHPRRDQLPVLQGNRRAFWQALWRHLLFGTLLGEGYRALERRARCASS